jgi:hypothetical protein
MKVQLDDSKKNELEQFILNNNPGTYPSISIPDYNTAKSYLEAIKNDEPGSYYIFGSNGMGYICYAYYKALNSQIYVITVNIQSLSSYTLLDENDISLRRLS